MRNLNIILFLLISITINAQIDTVEKTGVNESSKIYRVENEDQEMQNAMRLAKDTFCEFENALKSNNPNFKNFSLKKAYESYNGNEFLWIKDILIYDAKNKFIGIIGNEPLYTKLVKNDDIVEISRDEICDWIYIDKDVAKGGYTIRLLRSRMTDNEKEKFDYETNFIFK